MAIELSTTAPTEFVEANGIKYAYRRLGQSVRGWHGPADYKLSRTDFKPALFS